MTGPSRLVSAGAAAAIAAALAGCAQTPALYTMERYGTVIPVNVTLNCRDTYEVLDRKDANTLLVTTNPVNEVLVACYENGLPDLASRQRQVARFYFEERAMRPECRIVGETELTVASREFSYTCPGKPEVRDAPRRRG